MAEIWSQNWPPRLVGGRNDLWNSFSFLVSDSWKFLIFFLQWINFITPRENPQGSNMSPKIIQNPHYSPKNEFFISIMLAATQLGFKSSRAYYDVHFFTERNQLRRLMTKWHSNGKGTYSVFIGKKKGVFNDRSAVPNWSRFLSITRYPATARGKNRKKAITKNKKPMVASSTLPTSSSPSWSPSSLVVAAAAILGWSFSEHYNSGVLFCHFLDFNFCYFLIFSYCSSRCCASGNDNKVKIV